ELPLIDLHELGRLNICSRFGYTWAWVALGPERQQVAAAGSLGATKDAPAADEGAHAVPAPVQAPQPPPPAPQHRTMSQTIERLEEEAFDSTLVGSSCLSYERRVRPKTGDASSSTAPHTDDQPDP
ncbi:hypothetical protein Tco_0131785, partial [Tanacetum coccineum]